ncbi:MAG: glycosyltransferase [Elusimicrobiota bacterium]|jgi:abequosyltransferase|nr:glycosyltransferase [Elusimicrobiota bacterium]
MSFDISICIPTYNRQDYLKVALDSIFSQISEDIKNKVEICISDNASPDNTKGLIETYIKNYSDISIVYFRQKENLGVDRNFQTSIEMAHGKFYWGMSDDDIIEPGGIKYILNEIQSNPSIYMYYLNYNAYDSNLENKVASKHNLWKEKNDIVFNNSLECIKKCGDIFGYLSAYIMHRETLYKYSSTDNFIGTRFVAVYHELSVLTEKQSLKYIAKPLIGYRGDNLSDIAGSPSDILRLGSVTLNNMIASMFGKYSYELKIMKNFRFLHSFKGIVFIIINKKAPLKFRWEAFFILFGEYWYYLRFWFVIIPILLSPVFAIKLVKFLYQWKINRA